MCTKKLNIQGINYIIKPIICLHVSKLKENKPLVCKNIWSIIYKNEIYNVRIVH